MLISENENIAGARIVRPIGKITAASAWRASGCETISRSAAAASSDERMLQDLIRRAEDVDADAILAVTYRIEPLLREGGIPLERTCVAGIAVRILMAA